MSVMLPVIAWVEVAVTVTKPDPEVNTPLLVRLPDTVRLLGATNTLDVPIVRSEVEALLAKVTVGGVTRLLTWTLELLLPTATNLSSA